MPLAHSKSLLLPVLLTLALTVLSGVLHGRLEHRWSAPPALRAAATRLQDVPSSCGRWKQLSESELNDTAQEMLHTAGYIYRTYAHQDTGETVSVVILLGPPGPTSAHTPEICYAGRDFEVVRPRQAVTVPTAAGSHEFWATTLQSSELHGRSLRIFYAWSDGSAWLAAEQPRFVYSGCEMLYKIQVAAQPSGDGGADDLCERFLQDFLPAADPLLMECPRRSWQDLLALFNVRNASHGT